MKSKSWHFAIFVSIAVHFLGFFLVRIKTLDALPEAKFIQVGLYESNWSDSLVNLPGETEKEEEIFEAASQSLIKNDMQMDSPLSSKSVDLPESPAIPGAGIRNQKPPKKEKDASAASNENALNASEEDSSQINTDDAVHIEGPAAGRIVLYHQEPDYPDWAQQYGLEFQIRLKFWIQASGEVSFVEVENSSGYPEVDAEVIQVMKRWRFNAVDNASLQWGKILFKFRLS